MPERKTKTLIYKHASFHTPIADLKRLLATALVQQPTIGERRESIGAADESPVWRLVGQFRIESEFLFGVLMRYMPGANPVCLVDDVNAQTLTVEQLSVPETDDGKKRELLDGVLFFGCLQNHMVMMQSSSLRSDHLEAHLRWLLIRAGVLEGTNILRLVDQLPRRVRDQLAQHAVRELDIVGDLEPSETTSFAASFAPQLQAAPHVALPPPTGTLPNAPVYQGIERASAGVVDLGMGEGDGTSGIVHALKSLLAPDQAASLNLDALTGSNIEYTLRIRYRHGTTQDGQRLMNTLGAGLRHAEGVDTKIKLVGGGEIRGDDLRLSGKVRINTYNGSPNPDEVFEEMRKWLLERLNSGEVIL